MDFSLYEIITTFGTQKLKNMVSKRYFSCLTVSISMVLAMLPALLPAQEIVVGNYTFKDGGEYQGEMFRGKPWGKGTTTYPNGDKYEGNYAKGKRQGYGIYTFSDGERYEGDWYQDQQHGRGIFYFKNNNR